MTRFLTVPQWESIPLLAHGFGCAPIDPSQAPQEDFDNLAAWRRETVHAAETTFRQLHELPDEPVLRVRQIHSPNLLVVAKNDTFVPPTDVIRCDGIITNRPGLFVAVKTADCMPVLMMDPKKRVVAAVHAGWRGSYEKILSRSLKQMRKSFGTEPEDVLVALGPSARACCYEVGEELAKIFVDRYGEQAVVSGGENSNYHLDLVYVNRQQAVAKGIKEENIHIFDICTMCSNDVPLYSYRRHGAATGRMLNVIGLLEENQL